MNTVLSLDFQGEKRQEKSPYDVNSHHFVSINELKLMRLDVLVKLQVL